MNGQHVTLLHQKIEIDASPDEKDVLTQCSAVSEALRLCGYRCSMLPINLDLHCAAQNLKSQDPDIVFNLVESLNNSGRFIGLAPLLLEEMGLAFTGAGSTAMMLSSNKLIAKQWLLKHNLPTPPWTSTGHAVQGKPWIVKSVWEHASLGLDDGSIINDPMLLPETLALRKQEFGGDWFAELFVEGREFNVAILEIDKEATPLPVAEIHFQDFPADKPHIVGYSAKWHIDSFEYTNTIRRFMTIKKDLDLEKMMQDIALQCWRIFQLDGYARVDFRVDAAGQPWILEINANPCISPDAGFMAAANHAGLDYTAVTANIIESANYNRADKFKNPHEWTNVPRHS